jgi:hypothetical protein
VNPQPGEAMVRVFEDPIEGEVEAEELEVDDVILTNPLLSVITVID